MAETGNHEAAKAHAPEHAKTADSKAHAPAAASHTKSEPAKAAADSKKPEPKKADAAHPAKSEPKKAASAKTEAKASKPARATAARAKKAQPARAAAHTASKPTRTSAAQTRKLARTSAKEGQNVMNKQTNEALKGTRAATAQLQNMFGDVNERAKGTMERSARVAEELADFTRGNVEAIVASGKAAAKGVEALTQEVAEYSRRSIEDATAAFRSFAEVKSPTDFFRLQGDYARSAFDAIVSESARMSETMIKLTGDVAEPITSRYSVASDRVKNIAA